MKKGVSLAEAVQRNRIDLPEYRNIQKDNEVCNQFLSKGDTLQKSVIELLTLIFNAEELKQKVFKLKVDALALPFDKMSNSMFASAYKVFGEASQIVKHKCNMKELQEVCERFYSIIPQDSTIKNLLNCEQIIKSKSELVDSLLNLKMEYNCLSNRQLIPTQTIIDRYNQWKFQLKLLPKSSSEYKLIMQYFNNKIEQVEYWEPKIQQIFIVRCKEESEKQKKFMNLHNKLLLWHASRLTNFVGIFSRGLCIVPADAPFNGSSFGKGIYMSDVISGSLKFCFAEKFQDLGLLLLCEVALGEIMETTEADSCSTLPVGKNSILAQGKIIPDPFKTMVLSGINVPCGKLMSRSNFSSDLNYNEYVVFDADQVRIKYLIRVKFNFKDEVP